MSHSANVVTDHNTAQHNNPKEKKHPEAVGPFNDPVLAYILSPPALGLDYSQQSAVRKLTAMDRYRTNADDVLNAYDIENFVWTNTGYLLDTVALEHMVAYRKMRDIALVAGQPTQQPTTQPAAQPLQQPAGTQVAGAEQVVKIISGARGRQYEEKENWDDIRKRIKDKYGIRLWWNKGHNIDKYLKKAKNAKTWEETFFYLNIAEEIDPDNLEVKKRRKQYTAMFVNDLLNKVNDALGDRNLTEAKAYLDIARELLPDDEEVKKAIKRYNIEAALHAATTPEQDRIVQDIQETSEETYKALLNSLPLETREYIKNLMTPASQSTQQIQPPGQQPVGDQPVESQESTK